MAGYYDQDDMEMFMVEEDDEDVFTEQWRRYRRPYWRRPYRRRYFYRPWWWYRR